MADIVDTRIPTAEEPFLGDVALGGSVISEALYWVEDDQHVLRSTEFDVIADGATFDEALGRFVQNAEDFADYIADLGAAEITPAEADVAVALLERFVAGYRSVSKQLQSEFDRKKHRRELMRQLLGQRRRSPHGREIGFQPSSRQTSSPLSPV
jgi:hypothetical protein